MVNTSDWSYEEESGEVVIKSEPFHDYTVSFLAYIMWDPVHMYNAVVNDWKDVEHQITFDVLPAQDPCLYDGAPAQIHRRSSVCKCAAFYDIFPSVTLMFDELAREKYVDWYGYSASGKPLYPGAV